MNHKVLDENATEQRANLRRIVEFVAVSSNAIQRDGGDSPRPQII